MTQQNDPPAFAVYAREQRPGARWRRLGTFASQTAANRFALRAMDNSPRCDWAVRREPGEAIGTPD